MIHVLATVTLQPQSRERFLAQFEPLAAEVRREVGCVEYVASIDIESGLGRQIALRPDVVTIIERWRDLEALRAHSSAPHMLSFRERTAAQVVSISLQVLSAAGT